MDERVLILAPVGRDAVLACEVLTRAAFVCLVVADAKELRRRLQQGAGTVLLTEEAVTTDTRAVLRKALAAQPAWSDLPLIVLAAARPRPAEPLAPPLAESLFGSATTATVLARPLQLTTLVSVVGASLRARRRQYELRDLFGQLAELNATLERRVDERTRALARSEEQFTLALHLSPAPMILVDPADECLVDANDAFLRLTGYARTEAVARTLRDLDLFVKPRTLATAPTDPNGPPLELRLRDKAGEQRSVLSTSRQLEWGGQAMLLTALFDITERKQNEDHLRRAIQEVMQDASWFSRSVVEKLAQLRTGAVDQTGLDELSARERQVLGHLASGKNNDAIAAELSIATQTVRNYISTVYDKLGVRSRAEAIVWARERGLS